MNDDDCHSVANTIDIFLNGSNYSETDYICIKRYKKEDLLFLKSDYDKIENVFIDKYERINSIATFIENKISLQGVLF